MSMVLVDGHYYAYRSFYAITSLTNSKGEPTNAAYGFASALLRMVEDLKPTRGAVIFDGGIPRERLDTHPEYKANRKETPEALEKQFPLLREVAEALGWRAISVDEEEADDVIASYVMAAKGPECVVATNDKDLMVLAARGCRIYQPQAQGFALLGTAEVEAKWGVPAEKVPELLALTGDTSDNFPGVPGVGPKTAAKWILEHGTAEAVLAAADSIQPERLRPILQSSADIVRRNRKMVELRTAIPLPVPLQDMVLRPNPAKQVELFRRLEFKRFTRDAEARLATAGPRQADLFGEDAK
ncbi:MAG: flap endonuclease [Verrucomicrobia bacterium]|nr:flap endonuclease [Verrucomicrobiota bacterium]